MKLYIIGNGFDLAHNLKTSYWDFRCYLKRYAEKFLVELEKMYGYYPYDPTEYHMPKNKQNEALRQHEDVLYHSLWQSFESSLGDPEESQFHAVCDSAISDMEDLESGPIGIEDTLNHYFEKQFGFVSDLQEYLLKWAKQIRLNKAIVKKDVMRFSKDLFLSFNYTATLERIYSITPSNICHIHGGIPPYCNTPPIIGHGNTEAIQEWDKWKEENDDLFDEGGVSKCRAVSNFYSRTLKNTSEILIRNISFFKRVKDIRRVIVIGHSFGKVDLPYFKRIVDLSSKHIPWTIVYYLDKEKDNLKGKAKELGLSSIDMIKSDDFWDR